MTTGAATGGGGDAAGWRGRVARAFDPRLLAVAALAGMIAGIGGVAFRLLLSALQWIAFGSGSENLLSALAGAPAWRIVLVPALGGALVGLYFRYVFPQRRPLGPADALEAAMREDGRLPVARTLLGTLANALSLAVGASVGREGPIVLLGAAIGVETARLWRAARSHARVLLACGVAGCVGASFNAPLAGAVFAFEVILLRYSLQPLPALALASAMGTLMSRAWFGNADLLPLPHAPLSSIADLGGAAAVGLAGAAAALAMMRSIFALGDLAARWHAAQWIKTGLAGLAVGIAALWLPEVLSYGQEAVHRSMLGAYGMALLLAIVAARLVATALCFGSGFGGGVFSPALVIGAALGGALGHAAALVMPGTFAHPGAYAVLGAAAVAAPVLGAPLSTALILLEMTDAWRLAPALAIAALVGTYAARPFAGRSFFTMQLRRRGTPAP